MDFFDRQDKARRSTKLLVFYFVTGVVLLIVTVYIAVSLIFFGVSSRQHSGYGNPYEISGNQHQAGLWNPKLFLGVAIGTLAVIGVGSAFKTMELSQGGSAVADMMGGRLISPNTSDPDERKLVNVVEEMALASGVPVPKIYVMDNERSINAFAGGHTTSDAVVAVTRGCMQLLSRDELQGVIGHEFSHILNGDMRLNIRLMGIVFGIICIAVIGRVLLYARGSGRDRNALPLLGLALVIIGGMGVFFGQLIQAAVSRQREFLADASSVQFTRNPAGLSGALKKIGGLAYGSKISNAHAGEVSHMFFGNGVGNSLFGLMATHPPLTARIRAIDPSFDGKFPKVLPAEIQTAAPPPVQPQPGRTAMPFPFPGMPQPRAGLAGMVPPVIAADAIMPDLGNPTPTHLRYAEELHAAIPESLKDAARSPLGASALVYALLLSDDADVRGKQLDLLGRISQPARQETERLIRSTDDVAMRARMPLVDLALPSLRHFSPAQFQEFRRAIQQLIECDGEIDLFEYVLQKIVLRHLEPEFGKARKPVIQYYTMRPLAGDCAVLLSALAHVGQDDPAKQELAFRQGARQLTAYTQTNLNFVAAAQCDLPQVDTALNRLCQSVPQIKKNLLNACAATVAADGVIQEAEAELLRAIADTLDCPIPPFVQVAGAKATV